MAMAATPLQITATTNATQSSTGMQTATAKDANGKKSTTTAPTNANSVNVAQYNTANGILTGASVLVNTAVSTTIRVTGDVEDSGNGRTVAAEAALAGTVAGGGVSFTSSTLTANKGCSGNNCKQSPSNQTATTSGSINSSATVPLANLASYAGTGNVTFTQSAAGSTKVTLGTKGKSGTADGLFTFGGVTPANNIYSITYDYLNFANPSFDGLTNVSSIDLDFGSLITGSGPITLNFSIFNIGNANSAGVSLNSIARSNNNADFTTTLANFSDLVGGASSSFAMTFLPTVLGASTDTFTLDLADYAPAGSIGAKTYQLKVNTIGNVLAPPPPPVTSVPEPQVWALLVAGFGLTGFGQRRRRARMSVAA
ncbi:choice-of-anchor E domain-containing protein [Polymorphobacter arshaanensis]|nr:choice-of-anchor E domain-containing protein [Polymorphobacter arshaanensis]